MSESNHSDEGKINNDKMNTNTTSKADTYEDYAKMFDDLAKQIHGIRQDMNKPQSTETPEAKVLKQDSGTQATSLNKVGAENATKDSNDSWYDGLSNGISKAVDWAKSKVEDPKVKAGLALGGAALTNGLGFWKRSKTGTQTTPTTSEQHISAPLSAPPIIPAPRPQAINIYNTPNNSTYAHASNDRNWNYHRTYAPTHSYRNRRTYAPRKTVYVKRQTVYVKPKRKTTNKRKKRTVNN